MLNTNLGLNGLGATAISGNCANQALGYNGSINFNSSIFSNGQGLSTNYENDFLMPDFLKYNNCMSFGNQAQATQANTQISGSYPQKTDYSQNSQQQLPQANQSGYNKQDVQNYMAQQDEIQDTPSINLKNKTCLAGLLTPIATGLYKASKAGASLTSVLSKSTLMKCPIYAILGYLGGVLLENIFNKKSN